MSPILGDESLVRNGLNPRQEKHSMRNDKKAVGIIGFGNMGSSLAERIKSKYKVWVFDKDKDKIKNILDINITENNVDLVNKVDTVILAVKPQDFDDVLEEIKNYVKNKLIISIAAGISTGYIERVLGNVRVIRAMPNIGARIGEAESSLCKGKYATDEDLNFAKELFNYLGKTWIMKEDMIDAATAISGSGPAYIYYDMEIKKIDPLHVPEEIKQEYIRRLTEAAKKVGFDAQTAIELAVSTTDSSLSLTAITGIPPLKLRKQVTSKGGTTESALKILVEGGSWEQAALAAKKRAKELSKRSR